MQPQTKLQEKAEMKCECEVTTAVREAVFQQSLHGTTFHRGRKDPWPVFRKIWTEITNRQRWKQNTGHHVRPCDLGFTAMIIWRRRSLHSCCLNPKRVLHLTAWPTVQPLTQPSYVPASLHCDRTGDCCIVDGLRANSLRKAMFHIVSVILSSYTFILATSALYPPSLCLLRTPSKGKEGKGKAQMGGVQVKRNTPDLSWTEFYPNCRSCTHMAF